MMVTELPDTIEIRQGQGQGQNRQPFGLPVLALALA